MANLLELVAGSILRTAREGSLAMLAVMTCVAMASLDTAIANTARPAMAAHLHTTPAESVWIVNIYQLAMLATLLPFAALRDIAGHLRVFIGGLALFAAAPVAYTPAWSLPALIAARFAQDVGASAVMAIAMAMMRAIYPPPPPHSRAKGSTPTRWQSRLPSPLAQASRR